MLFFVRTYGGFLVAMEEKSSICTKTVLFTLVTVSPLLTTGENVDNFLPGRGITLPSSSRSAPYLACS